ncbi:MAG: lipid-A-disaccharide synthase [Prevotella sp.]|nr:lipid-A-disaccharide synthase [Candidatus Prevotella equi]
MRYYLIVGEASGDLHASHLMKAIKDNDAEAQFRFFGGDNMLAQGGTMVKHYRELAYMGFVPVLLHLPTILKNMKRCKDDIMQWQPDVVILVDYAGFNLKIAKFLREQRDNGLWKGKILYYIAPKLWAWKEYRMKNIKRDVDELFSILPFEKEFFEGKHHYPIHYVGNPTADEVKKFQMGSGKWKVENGKCIALLAGSRRQEIRDNLPAMLEATKDMKDYEVVVAGAPGIEKEYYASFLHGHNVKIVHGETYRLLSRATVALVTSGTATLETCMFNVPQVVCYRTTFPKLTRWAFNHILKVNYISLVNLIADKEVVTELFADCFSVDNIRKELDKILPGKEGREQMLRDYAEVHNRLGDGNAPVNMARWINENVAPIHRCQEAQ